MDDDFDIPKKTKTPVRPKLVASDSWGAKIGIVDVQRWSHQRFDDFVTFCDMFFTDGSVRYDKQKILKIQEMYDENPELPVCHFFHVIGKRYDVQNEDASVKSFFMSFMLSRKIVFSFIRKNPACISEETRARIKGRPEYATCFMSHKEVAELMDNAEMITADALAVSEEGTLSQQQLLERAIMKITKLYNNLAASITEKDIKSLSAEKKITLLAKLQFVHGVSKGLKPTNMKFTQINIKNSGREELEAALLDQDEN